MIWLGAALVAIFAVATVATLHKGHPEKRLALALPKPEAVPTQAKELSSYVEKNRASKDPAVQDLVGAYRIRLAYKAAERKDFAVARATLLQAAHDYKGTGAMSNDFGGVKDQALYQAAVCLIGEGQKEAGRAEMVRFMNTQSSSPLVTAAYKRIVRLDGKPNDELEALLQRDLTKQQEHIRYEASLCGPQCIEHLFKTGQLSRPTTPHVPLDFHAIARLCGTTDKGTTVEQMRKGCARLGHPGYAYSLNMQDLRSAPLPMILLSGMHYTVLERRDGNTATVFDPIASRESRWNIPDNETETVNAIVFQPIETLH